jgi:hypothetical protein
LLFLSSPLAGEDKGEREEEMPARVILGLTMPFESGLNCLAAAMSSTTRDELASFG